MAAYALQILMLKEQVKDKQSASIVLPTKLIIRESYVSKKSNCDQ